MSEIKCSQCGNVFYSRKSSLTTHTARCPDCNKVNIAYGSGDKKNSASAGAMIILFLAIIGVLAFGSIGLTYFARKKSWHWISYLGSLIIAVGSIYFVSENFEWDWFFGVVVFCNLFGILYAFYGLLKKWFKWAVLACVLLGVGIALWPDPKPIVYYSESPNGNIHRFIESKGDKSKINVFKIHSSLEEVDLRDTPEGEKTNSVKAGQTLIIDSLVYNYGYEIAFGGWCHVYVEEKPEIHGWVYQQEITEK